MSNRKPNMDTVSLSGELSIGPPVFTSAGVKLVLRRSYDRHPDIDEALSSMSIPMSDDEARSLLRYLIERYPLDAVGGV